MRLQGKLALALIPLVVGPVLALGWLSWQSLRANLVFNATRGLEVALVGAEQSLAGPLAASTHDSALITALSASAVAGQLRGLAADFNARLLVTLADGEVVFDSTNDLVGWQLPPALREPVERDQTAVRRDWQGVSVLALSRPVAPDLTAVALIPEATLLDPLRQMARDVMLVTVLFCVVLALVLYGWLRRLVLGPLQRLREAARRIGDGELRAPISVDGTDELGALGDALRDMGERLADYRDRIEHMAFHDPLTDLPNRRLIRELLADQLRETARREQMLAVLFLDLDNFKQINDNLGHAAGDALLRTLVARLKPVLAGFAARPGQRGRIHLARLGGDELLITLGDLSTSNLAAELADEVLSTVAEPFDLEGASYVVTASVGIALSPRDAIDADGLVRCADLAMYEAKADGRNTFRFFCQELNHRASERLHLERRLRGAITAGALAIHYQPLVSLTDGHLCGFEALLRWHDAELGNVGPMRFIPIAEETGLIRDLSHWVLEQVCAQQAAWRAAGLTLVPVSINISAAHLRREDFAAAIADRMDAFGLTTSDLSLELTESILMDQSRETAERIRALENLGLAMVIDDFGTGYSSLSYLRRFRLRGIKIDRSFISGICGSDEDQSLTAAIVAMARALCVDVVAEGIETPEQVATLRELGCEKGQGYLYARPDTAAAAMQWLMRRVPAQAQAARGPRMTGPTLMRLVKG